MVVISTGTSGSTARSAARADETAARAAAARRRTEEVRMTEGRISRDVAHQERPAEPLESNSRARRRTEVLPGAAAEETVARLRSR